MGYAAVLSWFLFLIILAFTVVQFRLAGRWVYYEVA
jgi:multiple sugar transport system permease protein